MDDWFSEILEKAPNPVAELYNKLPHPDYERFDHRGVRFYDAITDSLAIVASRTIDFKRQFAGPNFILQPNVGLYKDFDFDSADKIIDLGYRAADEAGFELLNFVEGK
jgi:predicted acylesterase/phospholipase RssA